MNAEEFILVIKKVVREAAIRDSLSVLTHVPGRNPAQELRDAAEWYRSVDEDERQLLASIIGGAVDRAIFGFLCVIDGVRAVENKNPKGHFELRYVGERPVVLNTADEPMLHDLYNTRSE